MARLNLKPGDAMNIIVGGAISAVVTVVLGLFSQSATNDDIDSKIDESVDRRLKELAEMDTQTEEETV